MPIKIPSPFRIMNELESPNLIFFYIRRINDIFALKIFHRFVYFRHLIQ